MTMISSGSPMAAMHYAAQQGVDEMDTDIDAIQNEYSNDLGFKLMYNEWMQKILLSDGVDEDENHDW